MPEKILFNNDWQFAKCPFGAEYSDSFDWKSVDIPHDMLIYDTKDLYETSTGWYRKLFAHEKKADRVVSIYFDGVYADSAVYVNGIFAGEWKYGYSAFEFDITDLLKSGENLITVRVNYQAPNSRWYSGAGIYRNVFLKESFASHILSDGVYISTKGDEITVSTEIVRPKGLSGNFTLRSVVKAPNGEIAADLITSAAAIDESVIPAEIRKDGFSYSAALQKAIVNDPLPWDIDETNLYELETILLLDGREIDRESAKFGFRSAEFTCGGGFYLNGRHVKIHGSCEHHDLGALGAAFNKSAMRRRLRQLKEMGVNAIRTSHNMPASELMELADEMGFLVLSEGFDMWERAKTEYDYSRFFKKWIDKDIASWVRRDRNHPSLIGWSLGNEIYDMHADDRGQEITSLLAMLVRKHDPRENGVVTVGSNYLEWENAQKCADLLKTVGYNYGERLYEKHRELHPDWKIYGSETASVVQSRGVYHFPLSHAVLADDDEQCSSLGNSSTGWGAKNIEQCVISDRDAPYCAGQFIWTGFDYIGESTPYSTKNSYFGQFDTAGFRKDGSYIFQAEWTDFKKAPMIHIFPYWDFSEGQEIDVRITTNAPSAELFLNGRSLGKKAIDHLHGKTLTADYKVPYEKGELLAAAYDENGNEAAREISRSFGNTARLVLKADENSTKADGQSLIFLEISALDENGVFVANANNRVKIEVEGEGRLIGLDNGDSTDFEQYKGNSKRLFMGKLLAIIAPTLRAGEIKIKASSPLLPDETMIFASLPCEGTTNVSANERNFNSIAESRAGDSEIPVRKIEFIAPTLKFTEKIREITVIAVAKPENSSYKDELEFKLTNETGIPTNLAQIKSTDNNKIVISAKGDGRFYLRGLCKNGTDKYRVLNAIQFDADGLGAAGFDPYKFVAAGLFTAGFRAGNGIERGAGFEGENAWFAFENVDFGKDGSDTVTVPIYANCTTPVKIKFYDGMPDKGGEAIGDFIYHEPPEWLTYKPNTFKLDKKLTGVHTFAIMSSDRYHVKGFRFERKNRAFEIRRAGECEKIYGDSFTVSGGEVTGIGNNVVLDFGEFDFIEPPKRLIVSGRSALAKNSLHMILKGADNTERVLAEFEGCETYTERSFEMPSVTGAHNVSFTFLPGSDFDFNYFKFDKGE